MCSPSMWKHENYTVFPHIRAASVSPHSSVGTLADACIISKELESMIGVSPVEVQHDLEHNWDDMNTSKCPFPEVYSDVCNVHGKVCKYSIQYKIQDTHGTATNYSAYLNGEYGTYNYTVGLFDFAVDGKICVVNHCNVGEYAQLLQQYVNSDLSNISDENRYSGNFGPLSFLSIVLDIDCAAGGGIPAQAIRLGLAMAADIEDIMQSEASLTVFRDAFVSDVTTALNVGKEFVVFVDIRTVASRRLTGRQMSTSEVMVTFDILSIGTLGSQELAIEIERQARDANSALLNGAVTSTVDVDASIVHFTEDGAQKDLTAEEDDEAPETENTSNSESNSSELSSSSQQNFATTALAIHLCVFACIVA